MSRPQGHGTVGRNMSLKNPVTPPGIDPVTVRLVAQRLNHYATPGPIVFLLHYFIYVQTPPVIYKKLPYTLYTSTKLVTPWRWQGYVAKTCSSCTASWWWNLHAGRKVWKITKSVQFFTRYSHAQHNDISVNDGPHNRRWFHKMIIL